MKLNWSIPLSVSTVRVVRQSQWLNRTFVISERRQAPLFSGGWTARGKARWALAPALHVVAITANYRRVNKPRRQSRRERTCSPREGILREAVVTMSGCIAGDNRPHRGSQLHTANWNRSEVEAISPVCRSHGKQCRKVVNDVTPTAAFPTLNVVSGQICLSPSRRLAFATFARHLRCTFYLPLSSYRL